VDTVEFLGRTALFSGLSRDDLRSVVGTAKQRSFEAGATIIRQGHEGGRGFYLLLGGAAEARRGDRVLDTFGPGDYFGEMALLLDDTPRTADVVATDDTKCLVVTQWDLKALITAHPEIGVRMMAELARRLRDTDQTLQE